jgi:hypothetical protein
MKAAVATVATAGLLVLGFASAAQALGTRPAGHLCQTPRICNPVPISPSGSPLPTVIQG